MKVKILNNQKRVICPNDMTIGEVGVIVKWSVDSYVGQIVSKVEADRLQSISHKDYWNNLDLLNESSGCLVEILPKGTVIEFTVE